MHKNRRQFNLLLLVLAFLALVHCTSVIESARLDVTPQHRKFFPSIQKERYSFDEMEPLFERLRSDSDQLCRMLYGLEPYNDERVEAIVGGLNLRKNKKEHWYNNLLHAMVAGCFNFFQMNDRAVDRNFAILKGLVPEEHDCFTVGFTQLYIMQSVLRCRNLVSIDANWRIHDLHFQLLKQYFGREKSRDIRIVPDALSRLQVHWKARFDRKPEEKVRNVGLETFCMDSELTACLQSFEDFSVAKDRLKSIRFELGFIHDVDLTPKRTSTSIVFTSNAMDWEYTSRRQYALFRKNLERDLKKGHRLVLVHQAGDSQNMGVYEWLKDDFGNVKMGVLCRDNLVWSFRYKRKGKPFQTWMDEELGIWRAAPCRVE